MKFSKVFLHCCCAIFSFATPTNSTTTTNVDGELYLHADNIFAKTDDFYTCTPPIEIEQPEIYVTKISPKAVRNEVHHLVVFAYK